MLEEGLEEGAVEGDLCAVEGGDEGEVEEGEVVDRGEPFVAVPLVEGRKAGEDGGGGRLEAAEGAGESVQLEGWAV